MVLAVKEFHAVQRTIRGLSHWIGLGSLVLLLAACASGTKGPTLPMPLIEGIVWQPHNGSIAPKGRWDKLGVRQLLIQWMAVENLAFVPGSDLTEVPVLPDWNRITGEPWASEVILGLAGRFHEPVARAEAAALAQTSAKLAALPTPLNVVGWYFPVEVDPTWKDASRLAALLAPLPRPLWISVYDNSNIGATALSDSLSVWLPKDVGVFFQDGVGVHARDATAARQYADTLVSRFGSDRVRLIAEVFRPAVGGGFRAATSEEIQPQLAQYHGHRIFLFDGPTYLSDELVDRLLQRLPQNAIQP